MTRRISNIPWDDDSETPASSGKARAAELKAKYVKPPEAVEAPGVEIPQSVPEQPVSPLAKVQLPARIVDDFDRLAESSHNSAADIHGSLLKFIKGDYRTRDIDLALGTRLVVLGGDRRWNKFQGSTLLRSIKQSAEPLPLREELDDLDPSTWEDGLSGKKDPWVLQSQLFLTDPDNYAEYTFTSSSWGGDKAIQLLARQVQAKRLKFPGAQAIIELQTIKRVSKKWGAIPSPHFPIAAWLDQDGNPINED